MLAKRKGITIFQLIAGTFFLVLGCLLPFIGPSFIKCLLETFRTLKPDGRTFDIWQKYPMPMYYEFYLFNWTNPEDVYEPTIKPRFQEIGPFVFEERKEKVNITWHNDNNTVSYRLLRHWFFDEAKSAANLSTKIVTINGFVLSAAYRIRYWNYILQKGFDFSLRSFSEKIYVEKTVGEMLFDGYTDPMIAIAKGLPFPKSMNIPDIDKFGWFYQRNGSYTYDGVLNVQRSGSKLGELLAWNYKNESTYFSGTCNAIRGTTGEFYPLPASLRKIELFWSDACRPITMDFVGYAFVDGTRGYKYITGDSFFDNGTKIPENRCYQSGEGMPSGVLNASTCRYGAPGFISMPHFYGADRWYTEKLEGMRPDREKHEMFGIIEPTTGAPLHGIARLQLNVLLQPIKYISMYKDVPTVYIPVLWIQQEGKIPNSYHCLLKIFLKLPVVFHTLTVVSFLLGVSLYMFGLWKSKLRRAPKRSRASEKVRQSEIPLNDGTEDAKRLLPQTL